MKAIAILLWVIGFSFSAGLHAATLRCDRDLAQVGDSKASVLQKCGSPFFAESFCNPAYLNVVVTDVAGNVVAAPCAMVDEWSYNPGSGQFIATMRFEAGAMTSIRFGDRVP